MVWSERKPPVVRILPICPSGTFRNAARSFRSSVSPPIDSTRRISLPEITKVMRLQSNLWWIVKHAQLSSPKTVVIIFPEYILLLLIPFMWVQIQRLQSQPLESSFFSWECSHQGELLDSSSPKAPCSAWSRDLNCNYLQLTRN